MNGNKVFIGFIGAVLAMLVATLFIVNGKIFPGKFWSTDSASIRNGGDTVWTATKYVFVHDTLVYMITTDSVKMEIPNTGHGIVIVGAGYECCTPIDGDRFKNGKTKDTIYKHTTILY